MLYRVEVIWKKIPGEKFSDLKYNRKHTWRLDCGLDIPASSSPNVVPVPMSEVNAIDPEEAFIASVSSCHMLFFLSIAAGKKIIVESYKDNAEGTVIADNNGKNYINEIRLKPYVKFSDNTRLSHEQLMELHQLSHEKCFIANSIKSRVFINPSGWGERW